MIILIITVCIVISIVFSFLIYMLREARLNIILTKDIDVKTLPKEFDGFSIYFISDVHRRRISDDMLPQTLSPDIVIIGGDLTEEGVPFSRVRENVQKLRRFNVPILFVWGNHDLYVDRYSFEQILIDNGVKLLNNSVYTYKKAGLFLNLIGVCDSTNELDRLDEALEETLPGTRVLISHNPNIVEKIKVEDHIPLVISGHTHGGQIRVFGWGIREKAGVWTKPFGTLIISAGYGTTSYPLRLGAPPDALFIRLHPSDIQH
ncbi:putative MPP superfamily phosphohydrolase [Pullulanibacillus pueri]|uniref:Metallophosphoesterase n=1 Tax=Pullulanibacillus pueri TaxID=1437324 RepID=A0A8J2ZVC8_9BACL|nr:metallophosphoesterase [Pullulanibacillus pueri]MBM7681491.1 putative MPP superfamily phosphohydrolase [Pullulanibacillus pueri]GGH79092.1 metallophosphoesterase [Pullulanibacillus pueri]